MLILLVITSLLDLIWPVGMMVPLAVISILVMVWGFHHLGTAFKWATGIFFTLGLLIVIGSHFSLEKTAQAINSMDNLIVLLIVMQLFTMPIEVSHYQQSIVTLVNGKLPTNHGLFVFTMLITFLLSMGTIPIIYSVLGPTMRQRVRNGYQQYSSVTISRLFTLGTLWAPGAATIFLISTITHVPLQKLFIPSFVLGILGLLLSYLMEYCTNYMQGQIKQETAKSAHTDHAFAQVTQIVMAVVILLMIAFSLIHFKVGEAMIDVALAGLIVVDG